MSAPSNTVRCSACGKTYPWNAKFAGRQAKCPCGQVMVYPVKPPVAQAVPTDLQTDDGDYDLAPDPVRPQPGRAPSAPQAGAEAPAPVAKVLSYRSAAPASKAAGLDTDKLTKQTAPLFILVGGLIVEALLAHLRSSNPTVVMVALGFSVGVGTVLMTIGVLIVARLRQLQIGSIWSAALRLAAISIGTSALADALQPFAILIPCIGGLSLLVVDFVLYFALLGVFFDLDQSDTWACVWVIFIIKVVVYVSAVGLLVVLLHH